MKTLIICLILTLLFIDTANAQKRGRGRRGGDEASLAQPYRGIISGGKIETGLFEIQSTGVTTEPVVKAARDFLASLSEEQQKRTKYLVDDLEWRKWDNRHFYKRQGVGFDEMEQQQLTRLSNYWRQASVQRDSRNPRI